MYGAGDVRVETVPNPTIQEPTDAIVRIVAGCICGSDLWPYASRPDSAEGSRMGHEFVGIVEELGSGVTGLAIGDFVIAPFVASDGTCDFCKEGLQTSCRHGAPLGRARRRRPGRIRPGPAGSGHPRRRPLGLR
jgi:threonine dehydrogenase-like Zn-dependent dehydrogenase